MHAKRIRRGGVPMSQLVKKAQRGDKNAFITLMEEQKQTMYKVAVGILRNDADAADAMQDTVLSCYENLQSLREPKYFQTWMTRILINHCNRIIAERKKVIPMDSYLEKENIRNVQESADELLTINEEFLEMLKQLEEKYRIVLLLYYVEEFSIKEISCILQLNENTIKTRLARGRGHFRKIYMKKHAEMNYQIREG